jgi:uncharacterized protein YgbK (DUF1537 family)
MRKALVIADDLSGAAEIAGIGHRYGLPTRLARERPRFFAPGLTVIDTDSRSLPPEEAAAAVARCVAGIDPSTFDLIYKKTDSVLRGPVAAEIDALMTALRRPAALLVPQNPSRARVIANGTYSIDDVPLGATAFAGDPEYPARSSLVLDLLGDSPRRATCVDAGGDVAAAGITIGAGAAAADLRAWAPAGRAAGALPAGGAEFFEANLQTLGLGAARHAIERLREGATLFADGSASAYSAGLLDRARRENLPVTPMPADVFRAPELAAKSLDEWTGVVGDALTRASRCLMTIGRPMQSEPGDPAHLQRALADAVEIVLNRHTLSNLLLAGGATASAICRRLNWNEFTVRGELDSGVVQLEAPDPAAPHVIVKPGSYPWPELVWWH